MSEENSFLTLHANQVRELVASNELLREWPIYRRILLSGLADEPNWFLALPVISCLAVGGSLSNGQPVAVGWYLINQAAHLLDAVQDGNFVPDESISTAGKAVNHATSLIFIAFQSLGAVQQKDKMVTRIFSESGFKSTLGQDQAFDQDSANLNVEEALNRYWQATILKSGSLFRMATAGGAAAGTDNPRLIEAAGEYGIALGVILQILDDCRDVLNRQTGGWEISLPVLLYSLTRGEKEIIRPDTRAQLKEAAIPQMISSILADWWQRALDSLAPMEPSLALDALRNIFPELLKITSPEILS